MHAALEPGSEILQDLNRANFSQSQLFQPGHEQRLDLHTTLEPGSEILQDPESNKSSSKSLTLQLGQELQPNLHTVKSLEYDILQPLEHF